MPTKKRFTEDSYRKEPWFRSLCLALVACKTDEDMGNFLRDIATLSELQSWCERLEVARQLVRGLSYRAVAKSTGASTTTVTRVAKFIENGAGGYRKVLHAHRHHRLHAATGDLPESEAAATASVVVPKDPVQPQSVAPVSVLQKYLQRPGKDA